MSCVNTYLNVVKSDSEAHIIGKVKNIANYIVMSDVGPPARLINVHVVFVLMITVKAN